VIFYRNARSLDSIDEAANDDSASALNVVVEHAVGILVAFQSREWVLEIFELDDDAVTRLVWCVCDEKQHGTYFGHLSVKAAMSSSRNSFSSSAVTLGLLEPMYSGSSRRAWLLVPRSRVRGKVASGLMPAQAVYKDSLPTGIPIPFTPRSPRPKMRDPSVRTVMST
jgi:hypothetical protein